MTNGKTLILYMTPSGFLTVLWKNLFNERRDYEGSKILFDLHKKDEHWAWEYSGGIHIYRRRVFLLKVYLLSMKLGKYFHRSRLKVKGPADRLLKFTASLCGVLVLVCAIPIYALLLLLFRIVSSAVMFHRE